MSRYSYSILDSTRRELLSFHWHPYGRSRFTTPHLHVSGARPIAIAQRLDGDAFLLDIGKAHLPTRHVLLEDIVELLIADPVFAVAPRRADWRRVVATNRAAQTTEGSYTESA